MSKPRMYGSVGNYTPNNRMDERHNPKEYQHRISVADRGNRAVDWMKNTMKDMEEMKQ